MVIGGSWTTPAQKQEAAQLLTFLNSDDSLRDGVTNRFRPAHDTASISLAPEIERHQAQGFQSSFSAVELPPYDALNDAAFRWSGIIGKRP